MIYSRIFPRYNIERIPSQLNDSDQLDINLKILNFSMGGLLIESDHLYQINQNIDLKISLMGKENFLVSAQIVWHEETGIHFQNKYGVQIRFSDEDNYNRWKKIALALHMLRKKKKSKR